MRKLTVSGLTAEWIFPVLLLVGVLALFGSLHGGFLTAQNLQTILRSTSTTGAAALGLTFVIIVRHYDMSFPWVAALAAMTAGFLIAGEHDLTFCILAAIAVGLFWGSVNGIAVGYLGLPDIISTIATGSISFGLAYLFSNGVSIYDNFLTSGILDLNDQAVFGVQIPILALLILYAVAWFVLAQTRFGRAFYATGENRTSAVFSGIRVRRYVFAAFCISTSLSGWAAVLVMAAGGQADVRTGLNFLMPAYAAVYLGAALFGRPSAGATLYGSVLLSAMLNGFLLLGMPFYYTDAIVSVVLVLALGAANETVRAGTRRALTGWRRGGEPSITELSS